MPATNRRTPMLSSYPACACLRPTSRDFCAFHARTAFEEGHAGVPVGFSTPSFTQLRRFVLTFGQYLDMAECGPIHSPLHGAGDEPLAVIDMRRSCAGGWPQ